MQGPVRLSDLIPAVMKSLADGLDSCKSSIRGFAFHVHVVRMGNEGGFTVQLSTSKKPKHSWHSNSDDTLSMLQCKVRPELYEGQVMLDVRTMRNRRHAGEVDPEPGHSDWYNQSWRHERFVMTADARALWCILEQNADLTRLVREVIEE